MGLFFATSQRGTHSCFWPVVGSRNSLDGLRNGGLEVGQKFCPAFWALSVLLDAALQAWQTDDMLAGQDGRLCEVLQTNWAGDAKPSQDQMS